MPLKRILIIDSGSGGIQLLKKLMTAIPADYVFYADTRYFPYGEKGVGFLRKRAEEIIREYKDKTDVVVLGCNTMSLAALNHVSSEFSKKTIYGCVPPVTPATMFTINNAVVLTSDLTAQLVKPKAENVIVLPAQELVTLVENDVSESVTVEYLRRLFSRVNVPFDCIVLGCTHFSLVKRLFYRLFPAVKIFDSTDAVVGKLKKQIGKKNRRNTEQSSFEMIFSDEDKVSANLQKCRAELTKYC